MKKKPWYSNRFARNILTDKTRRDAVCATKKDFVVLREELERKYSEEELLSEVHVEFNPYEVTECFFKRK